MALYMLFARYEPAVVKTLLEYPEALTERDDHAEKFYGSLGGRVVNWWFIRDAEYHFVVIVDFPDDAAAHAALLVGYASGAFQDGKILALTSPNETLDVLQKARPAYEVFNPPHAPEPTS